MKAPVRTQMTPGQGGSFETPPKTPERTPVTPDHGSLPGRNEEESVWEEKSIPVPPVDAPKKTIEEVLKPDGILTRLKEMGVEITEEDIELYLFRGTVEKTVPVFKINNNKSFTAKIRTLTSEQYMVVEEIIGDSLRITDMTREGVASLRTLAVLAVATTELMGRPTIKTWEADIPEKEKALENMAVIKALAPGVVNKINLLHSSLTTTFNNMLDDGNSPFLTNS